MVPISISFMAFSNMSVSVPAESSEEEDAPSFAPSSSVDGNNTDSEFEKGLKLKAKALDPPKSTTTPVKDEYEFDEDDEEERVPPVDDKHLLKKEFRKDPVSKANSFISIPKMEVKTYSKTNSLTPKKPVRRILSDSNSSDEDDRTLCFTPTPTPRQSAAQANKSRDSATLGSKQQKDKNKVKKKRKKETKNNVNKEVRFGKVNDKFCTSDSETGDMESEDEKGSIANSNCVKDSALNLKDSSVFSSLSASSSSSSHGSLGSQKLTQSLAEQHPKQWRTDGWKTVSSPTWSDDSSLSDSVRTRLSSESDYSSADSSIESVKQVKKKAQDNKKKNNTHASALDRKGSDFYKNSNVDGTVSKTDKDGKVLKKHKVKHKHKNKEKGQSVVLNQDMNEKFVKSFTFDFDDSRQKSLFVESESPSESKVKLSKHDKDHLKKEDRSAKSKTEDKDWSAKELPRISKEEKSKKTKESNKERASKEEKDKTLKIEKEKGLKDKEKPKEDKQKSHKEDKKKKSKEKSLKADKKSEQKEEKHFKSEKDKSGKEEKSKKEKSIKEEPDYEDYDIKNHFLEDTKMSASDDHDRWPSDLSSDSSLYGEDSWDAPMKEYKANNSVKLIVETMKEESRERRKENKVKDKKLEHGDKRPEKKKDKESSDKSNEKKKDWTDKQKLNSNHSEKEKKRKESAEGSVKEKKEKESVDGSRDRKDSYEFSKERKDAKTKQECLRDEYGSETLFKDKSENESAAKSDPRERNHSGKEKEKKGDGVEKKDKPKGEKHKDKPKDRGLEADKDKPDKNSVDRPLKEKDVERSSKDKKDGTKDKHKDSHCKEKDRKISSEQSKDKKEKISLDKHSEREKDFLEFKKEEKKPEKVREKTWYKIEDIFTDESEDENDGYNGGVAKLSDSFGLLDSHRKDSTPDRDDMDHLLTDKHRKYSGEGKPHATEKQKEKEHKDKKKDKTIFDAVKERKGSMEKHKEKKEKESADAKHKERKDRASVDSNQDKKSKQKPTDKREITEEKSKSKYKDKPDHLKDRKPSKGSGENEKSLLEKLEEEAMNDYKDDSNDKNSEISSDSFTDRGHEPVLTFYDSSNDMSEDRRESLSISNPQDKFREKERHRHSSSSSSKKSHDKEKEKVKKDRAEKRDKSEEIREAFGRRESLPFEKEPMPLEADPYTFPYSSKADGEDDLDKTLEFEKEMSKKDKMNSMVGSEKIKDKKKKEKHKEKMKEEKHKYSDGFGSFRHSKDDQKSGLKESPQVTNLKDKAKEDSPKFDGKNKDRNRDVMDKDRTEYNKTKGKEENDKLSQSKDATRKDTRPRELLVDGDLRLTSFGKMLSLKDQEIEERHKRHKERMKQMEKLRHRSGDPKLKDKTKSSEDLKKNRGELSTKKSSSLESALKEKKLKDVGLPAQMMSPDRKSQPMDSQTSKDWLAGHQMKENLPASPRPDQNRPTGVPTPTSVISCPSFEEVMQTPRTPSCSAEDYPDIMFDGLDCQNSAMTMSMNACSPSFFDRYSSQNSSQSFQDGTCITPAKNMQLPLVSRSGTSEVRRPLEEEFKAEADKFLRQQNAPLSAEFESSASHLPEDKMPLDRLDCVYRHSSPCHIGVLSPRPDSLQPAPDRPSAANVGNDANELPPESMFNNYLMKPSTPVHRPDPQEPCLDIAAPPTPAPAALPPMDIDDLSESHQSEPSLLPSDPVSGSEYLPPLVVERDEEEDDDNEEDEEDDEEDEEDNAVDASESQMASDPAMQNVDDPTYSLGIEDSARKTWIESPEHREPEVISLTPSHPQDSLLENSCDQTAEWNSAGLLKSPHESYREVETAVSKISSPYSHSDCELQHIPTALPVHPSVTPPYSTYSTSYCSLQISEPHYELPKENVEDISSSAGPVADTADAEANFMPPSSTRLETFFTDIKPHVEENRMEVEPTCISQKSREEPPSYAAESSVAPPVNPESHWEDPFSTTVDELDDLGPFSLPDLPFQEREMQEPEIAVPEMPENKHPPAQIRAMTMETTKDLGLMDVVLPSLSKAPCSPAVASPSQSAQDLVPPAQEESYGPQHELEPEPQNIQDVPSVKETTQEDGCTFNEQGEGDGNMYSASEVENDQEFRQKDTSSDIIMPISVTPCLEPLATLKADQIVLTPVVSVGPSCSPCPSAPVMVVTSSNTTHMSEALDTVAKLAVATTTSEAPKKVEEIPQRITRNRAQMLANQSKQSTVVSPTSVTSSAASSPITTSVTNSCLSSIGTAEKEKERESINTTATQISTPATPALVTKAKGRTVEEEDGQAQHPRKRKFQKSGQQQVQVQLVNTAMQQTREMIQQTLAVIVNAIKLDDIEPYHSDRSNPYFEYLQIRKKIEEKRKILCYITPQAPQCYAEYVTYTGSYLLDGKPLSKLHIPVVRTPFMAFSAFTEP